MSELRLCKGFLGVRMLSKQSTRGRISAFLAKVHPHFQNHSVEWASDFLKKRPVKDASRLKEIVTSYSLAELPAGEIASVKRRFEKGDVWDRYLNGPYPSVVGHSSGYQSTIQIMHRALAGSRVFLELGCGPGMILGSLLSLRRGEGIGIDWSTSALEVAEKVCREAVKTTGARYRLLQADIEKETLSKLIQGPTPDTVILHNVAYTIKNKSKLISELYELLPVGGRLIFADPKPLLQLSPPVFLKRSLKVSLDAHRRWKRSSSPFTEHQLAAVSYVGSQILASRGKFPPFLTAPQWLSLFRSAGFRVIEGPRDAYFGLTNLFVLEK